ncbi:hypothetical protein B0H14DRAFT_1188476 [Mycena olivaceomarginata]|uniref:Uncharacterized protein n=1 Tax=Mycena albidolilacea TaxID=1033008 RepID=A0AAD7AG72_9AGAR|nr:hypothetical protein DFH08DRAFT_1075312 [Mycena albidolilacea]KAJ7830879.1 hypothetical protein B0H14DRAFT_1188476 [Mycena olivaceomarginata]
MTPRIPLELSDYILDALSTDHKTVGVCGLVSIDWVPRSRHILFSTVNLSSSNSRRFHELLGSPACTFASSVSHLGIAAETDAGTVQEAFYRLVTSSSFGRLACVQSLQLSNVDWTCFSVSQQSSLESGLARLTHLAKLELRSMSFHDLKGALRVVSFFPFIHHIRLIDVRFSKYLEYNISSAKTHQIPLAWQVVEIDAGDAIPSFLHCLSANLAVAPVGIRLLKFLHINPGHYPYVEEALRTIDFKPPS